MKKQLAPLQLIGVQCRNEFLVEQLEDSLKPVSKLDIYTPIFEAVAEIFKLGETPFKPLVLEEHHIRHFFTKLNAGVVPIQRFVGKQIDAVAQLIDYYLNWVTPKALGKDWAINRFFDDIEDLNGTYFVGNFQAYIPQIKLKYPTFYSLNVFEEDGQQDPNVDFNLKAKTKTKLKQLLTELTYKSKGETHERTK